MSDEPAAVPHRNPDGLWRWLLGGLVGGAVILGLLIAAYAVGYGRGRHHATGTRAAVTNGAGTSTTAAATTRKPGTLGPVEVTPALVARGKVLYTNDGCSGCHSLSGSPGAGPSFKDLAGGMSTLTTGETVAADDAYLERSIADPDAQIVKGYRSGLMAAAIASLGLEAKPDDIRALVAFIKSQS
jgi:mono/diheme cytochrome c family protein